MPIKILMPALSPTMESGNLTKWLKKEGDKVESGDVIAEIETDKATMEVESADEGILGKIVVPAGTKNVKVGDTIGALLEDGEDKASIKDLEASTVSDEPQSKSKDNPSEESLEESKKPEISNKLQSEKDSEANKKTESISATEQPKSNSDVKHNINIGNNVGISGSSRVFASPLAKKIASQNSINIADISGSGPRGRVIKEDVLTAIGRAGGGNPLFSGNVQRSSPEYSELPISNIREVIAQRLCESKREVPHFYLSLDCDISKLLEMRKEINSATNAENPSWKISVNDLVIKAVAIALNKTPDANASWGGSSIIQYNNVDISVAVAIKDGLITPIVKNADQKTVFMISKEMKELVVKAKQGALKPEEFQGGTASISNLGMYGIKQFNAIINSPQSCIFAVGAGREEPVVHGGRVIVSNLMNITLSCDHRVVDGAVGAMLLQAFKETIENPSRLLI